MAVLHVGDIKYTSFSDIKPINKVTGIWVVTLRSASDDLQVPGLDTTSSCASLTSGITASNFYISEGESLITITGGASGTQAVIATLHRKGLINNLSIDSGPA